MRNRLLGTLTLVLFVITSKGQVFSVDTLALNDSRCLVFKEKADSIMNSVVTISISPLIIDSYLKQTIGIHDKNYLIQQFKWIHQIMEVENQKPILTTATLEQLYHKDTILKKYYFEYNLGEHGCVKHTRPNILGITIFPNCPPNGEICFELNFLSCNEDVNILKQLDNLISPVDSL